MIRVLKVLLAIFLGLVIAVVVGAAVFLRDFYLMPDIDKAAVRAALAEYSAFAEEMANRPDEDRRALEAMLTQAEPFLEKELVLDQETCLPFNMDEAENAQAVFKAVDAFNARLAGLLDGGFVLQQNTSMDSYDFLPNKTIRRVVYWNMAAAVMEAEKGLFDRAEKRLLLMTDFSEALLGAPNVINVMISLVIQQIVDHTLVYLLPSLPDEVMARIRDCIESRPDRIEPFILGYTTEINAVVGMFETRQWPEEVFQSTWLLDVAGWFGYINREKWCYANVGVGHIKYLKQWHAVGAALPVRHLTRKDIQHSLLTMLFWMNLDGLVERVREDGERKRAILSAMDAIRQRRKTGRVTEETLFIPYDRLYVKKDVKQRDIYLGEKQGCVTIRKDSFSKIKP